MACESHIDDGKAELTRRIEMRAPLISLTTTNPLAPNVAAEYGASCHQDATGVYHIRNGVTQQDFDEALAYLVKANAKPLNMARKALYDNLQSEGHGRDFV
jgi:uncharacterized iron-regulated membrane protein